VDVRRLLAADLTLARATVEMMSAVFDEETGGPLSDHYLAAVLTQQDRLWLYAAIIDGQPVGGLTAHQLPMTRAEATELLIYDLAVRADHQRQGVGRAVIDQLLVDAAAAGIGEVWVPAEDEDRHAIEFYRRVGGSAQAVTVFTFTAPGSPSPRSDAGAETL
jgi:aminoglycoside 3-N-acetyltransferase I